MWGELIGAPGVGKSTLRRELLKRFNLQPTCGEVSKSQISYEDTVLIKDNDYMYRTHSISRVRSKAGPRIFRERFRRVITARQLERTVLFDESLLQGVLAFSYACGHDLGAVLQYFHLMPAPSFTLHCVASPEVILARNKQRSSDRSANTLDCIPAAKLIAGELEKSNVPIVCINTEMSMERQIEIAREVIE